MCRFATVEVMRNYGVLVETVEHNSMMVNNCVFTMMHHIAGDCGKPEVLLQVHILKAFLEMCDKDIRVTQVMDMPHFGWIAKQWQQLAYGLSVAVLLLSIICFAHVGLSVCKSVSHNLCK